MSRKIRLIMTNAFGGIDTQNHSIETSGTRVALFDTDNDGWPDLLLVNKLIYPEVDKFHGETVVRSHEFSIPTIATGRLAFRILAGRGVTTTSAGGLAVGDLWNDGRISAVVSNLSSRPGLLVNQAR